MDSFFPNYDKQESLIQERKKKHVLGGSIRAELVWFLSSSQWKEYCASGDEYGEEVWSNRIQKYHSAGRKIILSNLTKVHINH